MKHKSDLRRVPVIIIRSLGREKLYGHAQSPQFGEPSGPNKIEIDKSLRGANRMKYALHEAAHIARPGWNEEDIVAISAYQAKVLHALGYVADDDDMDRDFSPVPA